MSKFYRYYPNITLILFGILDINTFFPENPFVPKFLLIGIYFWGMSRPDLFSSFFVFCLCFFLDVVSNLPIGFHTIIYLTIYICVLIVRRHLTYLSFYTLWFLFAALSFISLLLMQWLLSFWYTVDFINFNFIATWIATVYCYPFISYILTPIKRMA